MERKLVLGRMWEWRRNKKLCRERGGSFDIFVISESFDDFWFDVLCESKSNLNGKESFLLLFSIFYFFFSFSPSFSLFFFLNQTGNQTLHKRMNVIEWKNCFLHAIKTELFSFFREKEEEKKGEKERVKERMWKKKEKRKEFDFMISRVIRNEKNKTESRFPSIGRDSHSFFLSPSLFLFESERRERERETNSQKSKRVQGFPSLRTKAVMILNCFWYIIKIHIFRIFLITFILH